MQWMYSKLNTEEHSCERRHKRDELLDICPGTSLRARITRTLRRTLLISERNHRSRIYLKSQSAIDYERSRNMRGYYYMIHPFSEFRMCWDLLMLTIIFISLVSIPFNVAFFTNTSHPFDYVAIVVDLFCIVDVVLHFCTGIIHRPTKEVFLGPKIVRKSYLKGFFLLDFFTSLPSDTLKLVLIPMHSQHISDEHHEIQEVVLHILSFTKILRIFRLSVYFQSSCEVFHVGYLARKFTGIVFILLMYIHWAGCVCYFILFYFRTDEGNAKSWMQIENATVEEGDWTVRYALSLLHSTSITFSCTWGNDQPTTDIDQNTTIILLIVGHFVTYFFTAKLMYLTKTSQASSTKYPEMTAQLHQYMRHKKLPASLQKKVLTYYDYRFQKSYFVEAEIMNSLSGQLRQDIVMHSCKSLVEKLPFFMNVPTALVVRIVACMRKVYALPNDVMYRAGDIGDSMYFIKSGTVAIYKSSGQEMWHFEDGNHFGDISLILGVIRPATIVAVENCELYRLDRLDFLSAMEHYPSTFERMKMTATKRLMKLGVTTSTSGTFDDDRRPSSNIKEMI